MTQSLVVTGVDGFVGRHVAKLAAESGVSVHGVARSIQPSSVVSPYLSTYTGADLRSAWPRGLPVDVPVVHLAGLAAVGPSFDAPQDYIAGNSAIVTHLCEWLLAHGSSARVVGISTGAVYASGPGESAHDEQSSLAFTSPYVVSKILVEHQLDYYRSRGLSTVIVRPFNHIGPGQGAGFLVPDLVNRLRALAPGDELLVGNLESRRDYTDVRDVARAYIELAFAPMLDETVYNVASGVARSSSEILSLICDAMGRPTPMVRVDADRLRPNDPASIVGDATRLRTAVGWAPVFDIAQTINEIVSRTG